MLLLALRAWLALFSAAVCDMVGGRSRDRVPAMRAWCRSLRRFAAASMVVELELLLGQLGQLICLTPSSLKRTRQEGSKAVDKDTGKPAKPAHPRDIELERRLSRSQETYKSLCRCDRARVRCADQCATPQAVRKPAAKPCGAASSQAPCAASTPSPRSSSQPWPKNQKRWR